MFNIFNKILDSNEKQIARLSKTVAQINDYDDTLSVKKLPKRIEAIKKEMREKLGDLLLQDSFTKEDIAKIKDVLLEHLVEVYALVRKAGDLAAKHRHYDVQLMGGIALFEGRLIELGTGEGKTLVATLPLSLYGLLGLGAHIVTVNDYLARRDGEWCGHIYNVLGLTTGVVTSSGAFKFVSDVSVFRSEEEIAAHEDGLPKLNQMHGYNLMPVSKQEAYACDITYCTNNEIGFDYLRDNMSIVKEQLVLKHLFYCIVDEADSILIDESRTPLIVSAPAEQSNDLYVTFAKVVENLERDTDYTVDEKQNRVLINDAGIDKVEKLLNTKNLWEDFLLAHHLENALAAKELYKNEDEYIVKDGQILIVDEFTGRLMEGRRFSEGMHQAIEAKEGVQIKEESRTMATITFQNLFRLYAILSGMTGTALTEAEEFAKIYNLDVVVIPTNRALIRKDLNDVIYKSEKAKFKAVIEDIKAKHAAGQPVLVGTISVEKSEALSSLLAQEGLVHQVLNAKHHEKEAEIISHAGESGQITISTNMAGRGTDITLGEGVLELGGLAVIGTERHESRRIDNQLRGRSGRQGDPGESRFYISLEDNLMRIFGGARVSSIMSAMKFDENIPLDFAIFSRQIESAQKKVESMYFDTRKHLVEYDDVLNIQREIIYKRRRFILNLFTQKPDDGNEIREQRKRYILDKVEGELKQVIDAHSVDGELDGAAFSEAMTEVEAIIPHATLQKVFERVHVTREEWLELIHLGGKHVIAEKLLEQLRFVCDEAYDLCEELFTTAIYTEKTKQELLRVIDILWVEHLDAIEGLKEGIGLSAYSQKDPLVEYKNQAYLLFEGLVHSIEYQSACTVFKTDPLIPFVQIPQEQIVTNKEAIESSLEREAIASASSKQLMTNRPSDMPKQTKGMKRIGRNDPCPCGSGKKFKKCGELNTSEHQARMANRVNL